MTVEEALRRELERQAVAAGAPADGTAPVMVDLRGNEPWCNIDLAALAAAAEAAVPTAAETTVVQMTFNVGTRRVEKIEIY